MKELKDLLEVIGIDFSRLEGHLTEYINVRDMWRGSSDFRRNTPLEYRDILHLDRLPDIRVFFETLLGALENIHHSPIFKDPRVLAFEARAQEMFAELGPSTRRYIPNTDFKIQCFRDYLKELQDTLDREAEIPFIEPPPPPSWQEETEEGLF